MTENLWPEQKCPLCKQFTKYRGVDFDRRKYFKCPRCIDFVIPKNDEETVAGLKQEIREGLSKKSSTLKKESALLIYFSGSVEDTSELKTVITPRDRWIP